MRFRGPVPIADVNLNWVIVAAFALQCEGREDACAGGAFVTDVSNAARTCLMDIRTLRWDPSLLQRFQLSEDMLPHIRSNAEVYGTVAEGPLAGVPISGEIIPQKLPEAFAWASFMLDAQ